MTCEQEFMKAEMSLPASLKHPRLKIHLLDPNCRATITNATLVSFQTQLDSCSTQHMNLGDLIIYHNRVIFREHLRPGQVFPRMPEIHFPIQCIYGRDENSSNSRTPGKVWLTITDWRMAWLCLCCCPSLVFVSVLCFYCSLVSLVGKAPVYRSVGLGLIPSRINTYGLKIIEEKVLLFSNISKCLNFRVFLNRDVKP